MKLGLKIDVDTWRGTREGVPQLLRLLERCGAGASFYFSLGPDHTGRALRRVFRRGFFSKVKRTSVLEHYGLRTLLYGTLLPGPDIGIRCRDILKDARAAGFEVGVHCWDHVRWQDHVAQADAAWTEREMLHACRRFEEIFQEEPATWAAAGWQTNAHAARFEQRFGYASDTRGTHPFRPAWNGEALGCPQLPTTLPTLDELIGRADPEKELLARTERVRPGQVFTAHAELEGGKLGPLFERVIKGWRAQGYELVSLGALYRSLGPLPRHEVVYGEVPGRSGRLAVQGKELPA